MWLEVVCRLVVIVVVTAVGVVVSVVVRVVVASVISVVVIPMVSMSMMNSSRVSFGLPRLQALCLTGCRWPCSL